MELSKVEEFSSMIGPNSIFVEYINDIFWKVLKIEVALVNVLKLIKARVCRIKFIDKALYFWLLNDFYMIIDIIVGFD